ncbi:hypothetical protein R1flu_018466 [Riccia fluitans]|uniref:Photosystem I assembly protein Ycf4 n=1 Tax=Riccia fluitans TaxID=41844 RepID=A0ABD1ZFX0_9MARC
MSKSQSTIKLRSTSLAMVITSSILVIAAIIIGVLAGHTPGIFVTIAVFVTVGSFMAFISGPISVTIDHEHRLLTVQNRILWFVAPSFLRRVVALEEIECAKKMPSFEGRCAILAKSYPVLQMKDGDSLRLANIPINDFRNGISDFVDGINAELSPSTV